MIAAEEEMDRSKFYENPYEDYSKNAKAFLSGNQLNGDLVSKIKALDESLCNSLNKNDNDKNSTVYTGKTGKACLYLLKYKKTNDKSFLQRALEITDQAICSLRGRDISFLLGDAGPLALGAIIYSKLNQKDKSDGFIKRLLELPSLRSIRDPPYEVLYGHAGYLYALLYLNKELGSVIPSADIKQTIQIILKSGKEKARSAKFPAPLFYEWHDTNYLGAAHGVSGILYILLCASEYINEKDKDKLIRPTIDWLLRNRFPGGNYKSSEGKDRDALVHWCHGAPGFVYLYLLASKVFKDEEYLKLALECGDVVWERGLLRKGYSICHGVSGNAYTFLHLFKETNDLKHLYRAACFADWCTKYPEQEGHAPDSPLSLFEGMAGLAYFLTDVQNPTDASFPAFALT